MVSLNSLLTPPPGIQRWLGFHSNPAPALFFLDLEPLNLQKNALLQGPNETLLVIEIPMYCAFLTYQH
jgi:hypothetical protein